MAVLAIIGPGAREAVPPLTAALKDQNGQTRVQAAEALWFIAQEPRTVEVLIAALKGDEILVTWRAIPKDVLGPWTVYYYPGEVVLTHLTKKSGGATYGSTWWNAKGDDIKAPESTKLPETPGETFDAPKDPSDQHPL